MAELAGPEGKVEVEENMLNYKTQTITAYYGNLIIDQEDEIEDGEISEKSENSETQMTEKLIDPEFLFESVDTDPFGFG